MSFVRRVRDRLRLLVKNEYFWGGLVVLLAVAGLAYYVFNSVVMPAYTRYDVTVTVPDVHNQPFEQAAQTLRENDLEVERVTTRNYNPDIPRNTVLDQTPPENTQVKPGRRIYLTVNSGSTPMVQIPNVEGMSLREGINRVRTVGLNVEDTRPDSIPSPYPNTITRQEPTAGDSLREGSGVTLWYSTGLGDEYVEVPDVTGLPIDEAQERLNERKIRSIVVESGPSDEEAAASEEESLASGLEPAATDTVARQSRDPGTSVRAGFEVRLYLDGEEEADGEQDDSEE